ncbi:MAG: cysteine desulfurase family protein [Candidatus Borkfalkiaceae bacterium]|nr:cysteine desulfurase family protein [Clostridia bacterium]MDY6223367.1 cysteine desulfurase family protein [Christensenellaceae bacterium]
MDISERIYLDYAASTPLDKEVLQSMTPYFSDCFGNANSQHYYGRKAAEALDAARETIAAAIGARDSEIYFTSGGTEADNLAVFGAARAQKKRGRTRILLSAAEHHAVSESADALAKDENFEVERIPIDGGGKIDLAFLKRVADERTALVAVMAASNELGTIQPVKEAAEIAHATGATFFTDAVQAAPYLRLNVKELGADLLSFSAHKFYGPKGAGILYVKSGLPMERLIAGGEQERGLRGGTVNVAAAAGAAAAYKKALAEMEENNKKIRALKQRFLREISAYPFIKINGGDGDDYLPSILNLRIDGAENAAVLSLMDLRGVAASAGAACAGGDVLPSRVLLAAGLSEEQAKSSFRVSFGKHNTEEEIVRAAKIIGEIGETLTKKSANE